VIRRGCAALCRLGGSVDRETCKRKHWTLAVVATLGSDASCIRQLRSGSVGLAEGALVVPALGADVGRRLSRKIKYCSINEVSYRCIYITSKMNS